MSALLQAGVSLAGNLFGALDGGHQARKSATQAFQFNLETMDQAQRHQLKLMIQNEEQTMRLNKLVTDFNDKQAAIKGGESRDTSKTVATTDFDRLVKDSEKAGFNPLTVLRLGGLAGYSRTMTVATGTDSVGPQYMTYFAPGQAPQSSQAATHTAAPQPANALGDAVNAALGAYNSYDPNKAQRATLEMGIAQAQLANLNSDTAANNRRFAIPTWTDTGQRLTSGGIGGAVAAALSLNGAGLGSPSKWEPGKVEVTNANPYGLGVVNPNVADAAAYENRYGELGGSILGIGNLGADVYQNIANTGFFQAQYNALVKAWGNAPGVTEQLMNPPKSPFLQ